MRKREIQERDVIMFNLMESMKRLSRCLDKQVVCLIVGYEGSILSVGINRILKCDKNCFDKEHRTCVVNHAEIEALDNLKDADYIAASYTDLQPTAYVSLFPCAPCQRALDPCVREIVTFGMAHKELVSEKVTVLPHPVYSVLGTDIMEAPLFSTEEFANQIEDDEYELQRMKIGAQIAHREFYSELNRIALRSFKDRVRGLKKN